MLKIFYKKVFFNAYKAIKEAYMRVFLEDDNESVRLSTMNIMGITPDESRISALKDISIIDKNDFKHYRRTELFTSISKEVLDVNMKQKS